jgi:Domain of unknown function (DUF4276)
MIVQISIAMLVEGNTDVRFLKSIVERTAVEIQSKDARAEFEILPINEEYSIVRKGDFPTAKNEIEIVLEASKKFCNYDILVIHFDADAPSPLEVLNTRFNSIIQALELELSNGTKLCKSLVPIIPVRNIEAWMLADVETLRKVFNIKLSNKNLGLGSKPKQVESYPNPKEKLNEVQNRVNLERPGRRKMQLEDIHSLLGQEINLYVLQNVPSYQSFRELFAKALLKLIGQEF